MQKVENSPVLFTGRKIVYGLVPALMVAGTAGAQSTGGTWSSGVAAPTGTIDADLSNGLNTAIDTFQAMRNFGYAAVAIGLAIVLAFAYARFGGAAAKVATKG